MEKEEPGQVPGVHETQDAGVAGQKETQFERKCSQGVRGGMNWQPIKDAPKDGTEVLLRIPTPDSPIEISYSVGAYFDSGGWHLTAVWASSQIHKGYNPTHFAFITEPK